MSDRAAENRAARAAARRALQDLERAATPIVEFSSQGRVLILGGEAAWIAGARIRPPLRPTVVSSVERPSDLSPDVTGYSAPRDGTEVAGHLGAFRIQIAPRGDAPIRLRGDLVLDLHREPLLGGRVPPPGYWPIFRT